MTTRPGALSGGRRSADVGIGRDPRSCPAGLALAALAAAVTLTAADAPARPRLTVVRRTVAQDQGGWRVDYQLRYHGAGPLAVTPADLSAKLEGWVSNSRVPAHAVPRWSSVTVPGSAASPGLTASGTGDVVTSADDAARCRERVTVQAWPDGDPPPALAPGGAEARPAASAVVRLAPGGVVRARVRLEHLHALYGAYDPLLGARALDLAFGPASVRDHLPLDREHYLAQGPGDWPPPPEDRRDTRLFVSAPDSLHLEAHVPGNQSYRFPERPVRYGTAMRLTFSYYIAAGTEGDCSVRLNQYTETPHSSRLLRDGGLERPLTTVGRWVKVDQVFRTEPEATSLALEFRVCGADVGEMWVDDVRLEPLTAPSHPGP